MKFWRRPTDIDLLAAIWNDLAASAPPSAPEIARSPDSRQLDPTLTDTVGWLMATDDAQSPDSAFLTRLEHTLMDTAQTMQPVWQPLPEATPPSPNGRARHVVIPAQPRRGRRPSDSRWVYASLAAALLLVLAGIGSYFTFVPPEDRFFSSSDGNNGHVIPAATESPIPDVPMYRGNPTRDGVMPGPGPAGDPVELWKTPLQGRITTSVALSNGVVFARTENGVLGAFDAATGTELWNVETGGTEETWPTAANGLVYVGIDDGNLLAYDAASGEQQWSYDAGGRSNVTEPVDGVLYGSSTAGVAFAIDASTSEQHWRTEVTTDSLRGPALADGVLYLTSGGSSGAVYALDAASGTLLWTHALTDYDFVPTPSVSEGRVYLVPRDDVTQTGAVIALDAATGDEAWRFNAEADGACTVPALADGNAFVKCMQGFTYALDAATGVQIWSNHTETADPAQLGAGQQYADGVIYQPDDTRTILALDAATGAELWRYEVDGFLGEMAISGGSIFFGTGSGSLYALGGTERLGMAQATPLGMATPLATPSPIAAAPLPPVEFIRQIQNGDIPFDSPFGTTLDADGNFLVVESGQNRILKLAQDGTQVVILGDASGPGQLVTPNSIAVDVDGNFYAGNEDRDEVVKFGPDGRFLLAWGGSGKEDGQFAGPVVADIDAQGRVWVVDWGNHRIQVFDQQGNHVMTIGGFGSGEGQLNHPNSLSLDADGNVYVAECDNRRVSKFAPDGTFLRSWDHDFLCLAGITVDDEQGVVYVADADQQRIQTFDTDGNFLTMWGEAGEGEGQFTAPIGILLDGNGNVYITDIASGIISEFALQPPLWPKGTPVART